MGDVQQRQLRKPETVEIGIAMLVYALKLSCVTVPHAVYPIKERRWVQAEVEGDVGKMNAIYHTFAVMGYDVDLDSDDRFIYLRLRVE